MDWLVANEPLIGYVQHRPMQTRRWLETPLAQHFASGKQIDMDCSESVTMLCRMAGLADPNGTEYDGTGFTGTMLKHLSHYTNPAGAETGALVVFGPGTGDHVCMVRRPHRTNPQLFSHGQEAGPVFTTLAAERRAHRPPVTFLSVAKL